MAAFDFHIGAQVHCTDGRCGKLVKLVVDPKTQQVTDLIVEKGFLLRKDRVLPVSTVAQIVGDEIHLQISSNQMSDFNEYHEVTVTEPAPDAGSYRGTSNNMGGAYSEPYVPMIRRRLREGIATGKTVIDRGTEVENLEKVLGHVDHVIVNSETDAISHIVVRSGFFAEYRVIPVEKVEDIGNDIFVLISREEFQAMPSYEPATGNESLVEERESSMLETEPLTLAPNQQQGDVGGRISRALAEDARTRQFVIEAICDRGTVTLQGQVDSPATRNAAEEIARSQPDVHTVVNELTIAR
jgi:uncharacterized protein YrrD